MEELWLRCPDCGGKGFNVPEGTPESVERKREACGRCHETGLVRAIPCPKCKGDPYRACKECGSLYLHCKNCTDGKVFA